MDQSSYHLPFVGAGRRSWESWHAGDYGSAAFQASMLGTEVFGVRWAGKVRGSGVLKRGIGKVKIDTIDENVMVFSAKKGKYTIEAITNFEIKGDRLFLNQLHLGGASPGRVGRETLWEMAKDLGKQHNVKEVIIQGAVGQQVSTKVRYHRK